MIGAFSVVLEGDERGVLFFSSGGCIYLNIPICISEFSLIWLFFSFVNSGSLQKLAKVYHGDIEKYCGFVLYV